MDDTARIQEEIDRLNEETGGAIRRYGFDFDRPQIEAFLRSRTVDETIDALRQLAEWQQVVNRQNHDGVTLTPALADFLAGPGAVGQKLAHLERLRQRIATANSTAPTPSNATSNTTATTGPTAKKSRTHPPAP